MITKIVFHHLTIAVDWWPEPTLIGHQVDTPLATCLLACHWPVVLTGCQPGAQFDIFHRKWRSSWNPSRACPIPSNTHSISTVFGWWFYQLHSSSIGHQLATDYTQQPMNSNKMNNLTVHNQPEKNKWLLKVWNITPPSTVNKHLRILKKKTSSTQLNNNDKIKKKSNKSIRLESWKLAKGCEGVQLSHKL